MKTALIVFAVIIFVAASTAAAYAYPLGEQPISSSNSTTIENSFNNLAAPFEQFYQSLSNAIGNQPVVGPQSGSGPEVIPNMPSISTYNLQDMNVQDVPHELDHWAAGISNFNPSEIITGTLNGIAWVLGLTQQFIQWLLGFVR